MIVASRRIAAPTASRERGLTMMELLVTVVILSLLMAGLSQLVVTNSQNATATGTLARMADTGRAAIQLLSADIRRANYMGGYIESLDQTPEKDGNLGASSYAITCAADTTDWARMVNQALVGINAPADNSPIPYACITDEDGEQWLRGDVLTVRYTPTPPVEVGEMIHDRLYLRTTANQRRLLLFNEENASAVENGENAIEDASVRNFALAAHSYFVGLTNRTCQGMEIPALFRQAIGDGGLPVTQELLAGVENLQLRYLVDNRYYDADDVPLLATGEWQPVDAVEVTVLVRAECPEAGFDINRTFALADVDYTPGDVNFRRQIFTTTIKLRN